MKKISKILIGSSLFLLSNLHAFSESDSQSMGLYLAQRERYYHYQQPSDENEGDIRFEYYPDSKSVNPELWRYRDEYRRNRTYRDDTQYRADWYPTNQYQRRYEE